MHTFADHVRRRACIGETSLASAEDSIAREIVRAQSIAITSTVIDFAAICMRKRSTGNERVRDDVLPVQTTFDPDPVSVKPVLQVHLATFVSSSCVQRASSWHPPLFTSHRTEREKSSLPERIFQALNTHPYVGRRHSIRFLRSCNLSGKYNE